MERLYKEKLLKDRIAEENAKEFELAEKQHVENMIAKYGPNWYCIIFDTDEDCIIAENMRYKEFIKECKK